jgi:hypothetical protein
MISTPSAILHYKLFEYFPMKIPRCHEDGHGSLCFGDVLNLLSIGSPNVLRKCPGQIITARLTFHRIANQVILIDRFLFRSSPPAEAFSAGAVIRVDLVLVKVTEITALFLAVRKPD